MTSTRSPNPRPSWFPIIALYASVRFLATENQPRTGPDAAATVRRKFSALAGFYDFGVHDA